MAKEIERKWRCNADEAYNFIDRNIDEISEVEIEQYYIKTDEHLQMRVRRKGSKFFLTIKDAGNAKSRFELEKEIEEEDFLYLKQFAYSGIHKTRYTYYNETTPYEIDVYRGSLDGLVVAEVEFYCEPFSEEAVELPFFEEEVTGNPKYSNEQLASKLTNKN